MNYVCRISNVTCISATIYSDVSKL